jgi:hypothetical protein
MDALMSGSIVLGIVAFFMILNAAVSGLRAVNDLGGILGRAIKLGYSGIFFVIALVSLSLLNDFFGILGGNQRLLIFLAGILLLGAGICWTLCTKELWNVARQLKSGGKK